MPMTEKPKTRRKKPIRFGSQRRDYILDRNIVIDRKTGKTADPKRVLNGDLDVLR